MSVRALLSASRLVEVRDLLGGVAMLRRWIALAFVLVPASVAQAVSIAPGDILVNGTGSVGQGVILVDPVTGGQTLVGPGDFNDFAVTSGGIVYAVTGDSVVRFDPQQGTTQTVSSGGSLVNAVGIAVSANEDVFVSVRGSGGFGETGEILRIDPASGAQSLLSSGGFIGFWDPTGGPGFGLFDTEIGRDGHVILLDLTNTPNQSAAIGQIFSVDPESGAQTLITGDEDDLLTPIGLGVASDGTLYATEDFFLRGGVDRIDPVTGQVTWRSLLGTPGTTSAGTFRMLDVAIDSSGRLLVVDCCTSIGVGLYDGHFLTLGAFDEVQVVPTPIPEPSTALLVGIGLLGLARCRRNEPR